eukprot:307699_1
MALILAIMFTFITLGDSVPPSKSEPYCKKAPLPFVDIQSAFNYTSYFLLNCSYNYWKVGNRYKGMRGYEDMFGDEGFRWNKSTIIEIDSDKTYGYMHFRAKVVSSKNWISFTAPTKDIQLLSWSAYEIFYTYQETVAFVLGPFRGQNKVIQSFHRITFFDDDSGVINHTWHNSTSAVFGSVLSQIIETTQYISGIGYTQDDGVEYNRNSIQFVFICLWSLLSIFVCVYITHLVSQSKKLEYR